MADSKLLIDAIAKAIEDGAISAPPIDQLGNDTNFVRSQTDVGIDPPAFATYVSSIKADPDIACFERTFANGLMGGGISQDVESIARLLLAQAIATEDIPGTVARFKSYVVENAAPAIAVMAVSGVSVKGRVTLGPDVVLVPMKEVPPSTQRGMALGQKTGLPLWPRFAIPTALVTPLRFAPVFYEPPSHPPQAAHIHTRRAYTLLGEAADLLSLLGILPVPRMLWIQPADWLMSSNAMASWSPASTNEHWGIDVSIPEAEAESLGRTYFAIEPKKRAKVLRIPLDRFARSGREDDIADRCIDLGIALEALLLHDLEESGELSFRLSLRGAWLVGENETDRRELQKVLRDAYQLRSRAVHRGYVDETLETVQLLGRARAICKSAILKLIELNCEPDWRGMIVGGPATRPAR